MGSHFDCRARLINGYWTYCPCGDCVMRALQDSRTGLLATVLEETGTELPRSPREAVERATEAQRRKSA